MSVWRFLLANSVILLSLFFFAQLFSSGFFRKRESSHGFLLRKARTHEMELSNSIRVPGLQGYHSALQYFYNVFENISDEARKTKRTVGFTHASPVSTFTSEIGANYMELSGANLIFKISCRKCMTQQPLLIATQFDTPAVSVAQYESTLYCAAALEVLRVVASDPSFLLSRPISFMFVSGTQAEESLDRYVAENFTDGHVLYLSSIGTGRPWTGFGSADRSSSIIRALAAIPGMVLYSGISRFFRSKGTILRETGAVKGVFMGNPSQHHTSLDVELSGGSDLLYIGDLLLSFLKNYKPDAREKKIFAFGVSPLTILVERKVWKKVVITVLIITCLSCVVGVFRWKKNANWLLLLCLILFVCLFSFVFGYSLLVVNPSSYASSPYVSFILMFIGCECLALFFIGSCRVASGPEWRVIHCLCLALYLYFVRNDDQSVPLVLTLIPQILLLMGSMVLRFHAVVEFIGIYISLMPITILFSLLFKSMCLYSLSQPDRSSDVRPLAFVLFYALNFMLSFFPWCLSEGCDILTSPKNSGVGIIVTLVLLFVSPFFNSREVCISGTFGQLVFPSSQESVAVFAPFAGKKIAPVLYRSLVLDNFSYEPRCSHQMRIHSSGPCFSKMIDPKRVPWSSFSQDCNVTSRFDGSGSRLLKMTCGRAVSSASKQVMIMVPCPDNRTCLTARSGGVRPVYIQTRRSKRTAVFILSGMTGPIHFEAGLKTDLPVSIEVSFFTQQKSVEMRKFMESFKVNVQHCPDGVDTGGSIIVRQYEV